jgi:hypothetical protein
VALKGTGLKEGQSTCKEENKVKGLYIIICCKYLNTRYLSLSVLLIL